MFIYSKQIILFIQQIQSYIKQILSQEMGWTVAGHRFYDTQRSSYPITVVIYNNKKMLGYFDPNFYELGFHESLMHIDQIQLLNIIRHELAHYITFIHYGNQIKPHGEEFKAFCKKMKWPDEVSLASISLNPIDTISPILKKIQKLMALSTSDNPHEAELAIIKSQQLLLKHNLSSAYLHHAMDEKMGMKRILKQKKANAKMRAIGHILETFFITTVYHRATDGIYLEILGQISNIEIAEYVADILQWKLDMLWKVAQKRNSLKGAIAKNSFFSGIAKGYCNKIAFLKRDYDKQTTHTLMVLEKQLEDVKAMAYPKLVSTRIKRAFCKSASAMGEEMGKQLDIHAGLKDPSLKPGALIHYTS